MDSRLVFLRPLGLRLRETCKVWRRKSEGVTVRLLPPFETGGEDLPAASIVSMAPGKNSKTSDTTEKVILEIEDREKGGRNRR